MMSLTPSEPVNRSKPGVADGDVGELRQGVGADAAARRHESHEPAVDVVRIGPPADSAEPVDEAHPARPAGPSVGHVSQLRRVEAGLTGEDGGRARLLGEATEDAEGEHHSLAQPP